MAAAPLLLIEPRWGDRLGHFARLGFNESDERDHAAIDERGQYAGNHEKADEGWQTFLRWLPPLSDNSRQEASAPAQNPKSGAAIKLTGAGFAAATSAP